MYDRSESSHNSLSGNANKENTKMECEKYFLLQFFQDGFDTLSQQVGLCFYYLAANQHIQDKAYDEVIKLAKKAGNELTGEDVKELKYLHWVLSETCRKGPLSFTNRRCTKDWVLPDSGGIVIPAGMRVLFSIAGVQVKFYCCWFQCKFLL